MTDADAMQLALAEAARAGAAGEVPVGAVLLKEGVVIATGRNAPIGEHDPSAHAEMVALRAAAKALGNYRLDGCELFVTLEPCAMCAGAMLHARLSRVVFGAADPKTGAAGSVVDLFKVAALNHQTTVQGGVLAEASALVLQDFFRARRLARREEAIASHPLREDALRTPDAAFDGLPAYPWAPHYLSDLPTLAGWRMHYLAEGVADATGRGRLTFLCLHGPTAWSYQFHDLLPVWLQAGHAVVAPDLVGFGKSDKPKKAAAHSLAWHRQSLGELVERLQLERVVLVADAAALPLAQDVLASAPQRYAGLLALDFPTPMDADAAGRPFPDKGFTAALRAVPTLLAEAGKRPAPAWPGRALRLAADPAQAAAEQALAFFQ